MDQVGAVVRRSRRPQLGPQPRRRSDPGPDARAARPTTARTRPGTRRHRGHLSLSAYSYAATSARLPESGIGAAAEQGNCRPAVAGDNGAVRAEAIAERRELLGARWFLKPPRQAVALANAEVADGPHVEPAQLEHEVHLRRP